MFTTNRCPLVKSSSHLFFHNGHIRNKYLNCQENPNKNYMDKIIKREVYLSIVRRTKLLVSLMTKWRLFQYSHTPSFSYNLLSDSQNLPILLPRNLFYIQDKNSFQP